MIFNRQYPEPTGAVTVAVDYEYAAELFWANLDQQFPSVSQQLRNCGGRAMISRDTWYAIQRIEGFTGGPVHAPTALIVLY